MNTVYVFVGFTLFGIINGQRPPSNGQVNNWFRHMNRQSAVDPPDGMMRPMSGMGMRPMSDPPDGVHMTAPGMNRNPYIQSHLQWKGTPSTQGMGMDAGFAQFFRNHGMSKAGSIPPHYFPRGMRGMPPMSGMPPMPDMPAAPAKPAAAPVVKVAPKAPFAGLSRAVMNQHFQRSMCIPTFLQPDLCSLSEGPSPIMLRDVMLRLKTHNTTEFCERGVPRFDCSTYENAYHIWKEGFIRCKNWENRKIPAFVNPYGTLRPVLNNCGSCTMDFYVDQYRLICD